MTGAIVTPGGGGGGCSLLEVQPAQMNSVAKKRARNETSMTSIQAMRWFYRRLLDAPQMPKCLSQVPRERGSASANPFRAPSLSSAIGGINLEKLAESRWPRLRTNIRHRTRALVS